MSKRTLGAKLFMSTSSPVTRSDRPRAARMPSARSMVTSPAAIIVAAILATPWSPARAATNPWTALRLNEAGANVDPRDWNLRSRGGEFLCVKKGDPQTPPRIVHGDNGDDVLRIELDPTNGPGPDHGRDKINYRVLKGSEAAAPHFGGPMVYFGFSVELDLSHFQTPTTGAGYLIAQWWQGAPFGPPLALDILPTHRPTDDAPIGFEVRNTETGANPSAPVIMIKPARTDELRRGKWYHFVVGTIFGLHNDAQLKVWINDNPQPEINWTGSMGYDPNLTAASLGYKTGAEIDHHPNGRIELYVGPYRDRMDATQVFYFDHVAYGPTFDSVN